MPRQRHAAAGESAQAQALADQPVVMADCGEEPHHHHHGDHERVGRAHAAHRAHHVAGARGGEHGHAGGQARHHHAHARRRGAGDVQPRQAVHTERARPFHRAQHTIDGEHAHAGGRFAAEQQRQREQHDRERLRGGAGVQEHEHVGHGEHGEFGARVEAQRAGAHAGCARSGCHCVTPAFAKWRRSSARPKTPPASAPMTIANIAPANVAVLTWSNRLAIYAESLPLRSRLAM